MDEKLIRKKIGQLMVFGFKGITASEEMKTLIREHHVGNIILFGRNIGTPEEIKKLTTELQLEAKASGHERPLLICIDQENGVVRRLGEGTTVFPGAMLLGATQNPENAYNIGLATGKELKELGINWNLAPTVDVNNNPRNPVIGVRSYGEDPTVVSEFSMQAMKGMQAAGVVTTLKHFPGHGDTALDSHLELPVISHDMERLMNVEIKPFQRCIEEGADTVMSAHVYFPAIEKDPGVPGTLSKAVITGLLREQLGFDGVVTTDCMEMNAIANTIGTATGAVQAIKAGVDLVMISHLHHLQREAIEELVKEVQNGGISLETLEAAVTRVSKLKDKYLSWDDIDSSIDSIHVSPIVGCEEHQLQAEEVFRQGVTIVKNEGVLPLDKSEQSVFVVYPENAYIMQVEDRRYSTNALGSVIQEIDPKAVTEMLTIPASVDQIDQLVEKAKGFETIIVGTLTATNSPDQIQLIEKLSHLRKKIVVVAMRSPYDLVSLPDVSAYIATYEFTTASLRMAAKAIYGLEQVTGTLPVTIPNDSKR
ncbi:beta-N-acetylhexosaminidase [Anaerobacillus alkaliphilus]|uniref:Beta-N-acetylhexosaminidase n=1 Tax=Anaerobacillus alkaliphilus TaxID=1548597 RepID=A0A4V1LGP2_9BACI|nr:beta-N-acetylhexosaminidase [Anaerobacillus alkaliphilus]RXJ02542.1 beta-N-acetylhexosaminidase [Anaerobacillus alkaliphilus]